MKIVRAETVTLHIPFYTDRVTRAMQRARTHSERILLHRLETDNGIIGYGEYPFDGDATSLVGKNPYAIMNDDSIGFGPQVAVLDAIGKDAGVPVHAYQQAFHQGDIPGFERGVSLEVVEDDNSASFRKQHADLVARAA